MTSRIMALHRLEINLKEHPWEESETYYKFSDRVLAELGLSGTCPTDWPPPPREWAVEAGKITLLFWLPVVPPAMRYVRFDGPGDAWVGMNANYVSHVAPLDTGTRITMGNGMHYDVPAEREEVEAKLAEPQCEAVRSINECRAREGLPPVPNFDVEGRTHSDD